MERKSSSPSLADSESEGTDDEDDFRHGTLHSEIVIPPRSKKQRRSQGSDSAY